MSARPVTGPWPASAQGRCCLSLACMALLWPGAVLAADDPAARAPLEQRLKLTAQLLGDSPSAQRIGSSGNAQAVSHLDEGRVHHALAQDLLARGDLAGARRAADDALRHLAAARKLVPDAPARQAAARQRHEQLLANIERLVESWRTRAAPGDLDDGDMFAALALVDTARSFGEQGRFEEGRFTLETAERHVLVGMNRLLHQRTLDYTARATTPAEEFQLELQRHRALADLVPLAVNELRPRADALSLIERYAESSQMLRSQALQRFQAGDAPQALSHIRSAQMFVQRALSAAGLAVPTSMGTSP